MEKEEIYMGRENLLTEGEHCAVKNAVKYCIENNILKEFFEEKTLNF